MNHKAGKRRGAGTVTVLVAITLTGILGVVAIALDGGLMLDNRRRVQAAADAAALAAASDLFANYASNVGYDNATSTAESGVVSDSSGPAALSAKSTALANVPNATVTVNIPPLSGTHQSAGYAEVYVQYNQTRGFSAIFGSATVPVIGRAVACGSVGDVGIMCLDDVVTESAQICGKVTILNGGQIYINSKGTTTNTEFSGSAGTSIVLSGATLTTGGINVYSTTLLDSINASTITYTNGGSLKAFSPQLTDPLASITEPSATGTTYGTSTSGYTVSTSVTLQPGQYPGGIQVTGGSPTLAAGVYYLGTGAGAGSGSFTPSFTVATGATLTGTGVMFYNQLDDNFSPFAGVVNITPPTTGTYRGISFWQPRSDPMEIHISGTANVTMPGTWYNVGGTGYLTGENGGNSTTGEFDINPSGSTTVFNIGSYICDQAEWFQAGTTGTLKMNPGTAAPTQRPTLVE